MEQGDNTLTRRDVVRRTAKVGAVGAAALWVAPRFESVAYAAGDTGSPPPKTTTTESTIAGQGGPTCQVDPKVLRFPVPFRIRVIGTKWAPTSRVVVSLVGVSHLGTLTTTPSGAFDARVEIPGTVAQGVYQIEMTGYDAKGVRHQCFERFEVAGATSGQGGGTPSSGGSAGAGSGNGDGTLPFTGAESGRLILIGASAVVAGRGLYALRNRMATMADDGDAHSR